MEIDVGRLRDGWMFTWDSLSIIQSPDIYDNLILLIYILLSCSLGLYIGLEY